MSDPYFSLARTTRPADWFERILPALPLRLPDVSVPHAFAYHVSGPGGGTWSVWLESGQLRSQVGLAPVVGLQLSMSAAHFREAVVGGLRDRLADVLRRLGKPVALPSLAWLPIDPARVAGLAALRGSVAFEVRDRDLDETYRFVLTLGAGPAASSRADCTVQVDADDLTTLAAARTSPWQALTGGRVRLQGDTTLPSRLLTTLLGK
jgi:hypothetical protein